MIQSRHALSHCEMCGDMVVCTDCGNNCCNGGTGEVDGRPCGCSEAYDHQDVWRKRPNAITFTKDVRPVLSDACACEAS